MSEQPRAVFISYASQDVDAAQRIASGLQAAGIEVWLDRSELRGGEAWDQGIRRQIRECTLFLPIVSDTTERRKEGYFRLEWRLADQRTHLMGRGRTFIVPVSTGEFNEHTADVPDSFLAVHWTRLPGGVPTPAFVEHVRTLLEQGGEIEAGSRPPMRAASVAGQKRLSPRLLILGVASAIVLAGLAVLAWPYLRPPAAPEKSISASYEAFIRVRDDFNREQATPASLAERESQLRKILETDPDFAAAWSLLAVVQIQQVSGNFDMTDERRGLAKEAVDNAVRLAKDSPDTIRSLGLYLSEVVHAFPGATIQFKNLTEVAPNSGDGPGYLGTVLRRQGKFPEALAELRSAVQVDPGNVPQARTLENLLIGCRMFGEAVVQRARIVGLLPGRIEEGFQSGLLDFMSRGDQRSGKAFIDKLTPEQADSALGISLRATWARMTGNYAEAIRLDHLSIPSVDDGMPAWNRLIAASVTLAANGDHAEARARLAGVTTEIRAALADQDENVALWQSLAQAEALLGNRNEALLAASKAVTLKPEVADAAEDPGLDYQLAVIKAWAGSKDEALTELGQLLKTQFTPATIYTLKFDPWWFPIRDDSRFTALLADLQNNAPFYAEELGRGLRGPPRGGRGQGGPGGPGSQGGPPDFGRGGPRGQ